MFTIKPKYEPKITVLTSLIPRIEISTEALINMQLYIEGCADEIGWLGTAYKDKNVIYIDKVYLFKQEVHSTTTEITPEGLSEFGEAILGEPNGMDVWNNLKMWGHSHVNMTVGPSGQDNKQMETFATNGHDWFVRLIGNKKGDLRLDVYDYSTGIVYEDLAWSERISAEEQSIHDYIEELYESLANNRLTYKGMLEPSVKEEIKHKVSKIVYTPRTYVPPTNVYSYQPRHIPIQQEMLDVEDDIKKNHPLEKSDAKSGLEERSLADENFDTWYDYTFSQYDIEDMQDLNSVDEILDYVLQFHGQALPYNVGLSIMRKVNQRSDAQYWWEENNFSY